MPAGAPGHEGWGIVQHVGGGVEGLSEGDRVAFLSNNAFAEYAIVAASEAVLLPEELSALAFPGEPLGCAVNVTRRSGIRPGDSVAVVGAGFLGNLVTALARHIGAHVVSISRRPAARELARRMGAEAVIPFGEPTQTISAARELVNEHGYDCVIEAAGAQEALDVAGCLVRERGRLVIAGYHQDGLRHVNMQHWNWLGLDVINAHERSSAVYIDGIRAAAELVAAGAVDPRPLYTTRCGLDELASGFEALESRPEHFMKAMYIA
jgi:threonine dehydrogenase-like Zn-dependent dehydrogenase